MPIEIPAAGLIATRTCTAACLLALDDECECRCGGRFHAALNDVAVPVGPAWRAPRAAPTVPPERTVVTDVLHVLGAAERMHSDQVCAGLGLAWPDDYPAWTPVTLARALLEFGVRTRQTWTEGLDGRVTNRSGVHRTELLAAARKRRAG